MDNYSPEMISRIIVKKITGGITPDEQSALDDWLERSPFNREAYERVLSGKTRANNLTNSIHIDPERTLLNVKKKIAARNSRRRLGLTAACTAVIAVVVFLIQIPKMTDGTQYQPQSGHRQPVLTLPGGRDIVLADGGSHTEWVQHADQDSLSGQEATMALKVSVPRGGREYALRLGDGTLVWLNSGTVIEYPYQFTGERREVWVSGEAWFEVMHDAAKPFIVHTANAMDITVLGTSFNVHAYSGGVDSKVTLVEGSVEVGTPDGRLTIRPDEQVIVDNATGRMSRHDVGDASAYAAWTKGVLYFNESPAGEIFDSLEKWYDIDIVCDAHDVAQLGRFTVRVGRREDFTAVLRALQKVSDLEYRVEGRTVHIALPLHDK